MSAGHAAGMVSALEAALAAVLPGAHRHVPVAPVDPDAPPLPAVVLRLDVDAVPWLLHAAADAAFRASLLARMLGRTPTAAETADMGEEALAEFCNLLGGRMAGIVGGQGGNVTIGIPASAAYPTDCPLQCWQHEGGTFRLALHTIPQEPAA